MQLEYKDYYLRTIVKEKNGLKLVLGGTGLGKTHGMREAVKQYLKSDGEKKKQFIYITNRHNLITEQKKEFEKAGFKCCYLKSNKEIILDLLKSKQIQELISEFEEINFFKFDEVFKSKYKREAKFKRLIEGIEYKQHLLKAEKQKKSTLQKAIENELNLECDELYKLLRTQIVQVGQKNDTLYEKLKTNKFVWKLFPYIEFENNPDANILLVTIQKVLMGFFDGKKDVKIASIENRIVFLDEFDFLEQEILKTLCDEPSIINPLEFVRIFYEKFKHWSVADFWDSTEELKKIREQFNAVIEYLDKTTKEKGLNFPRVIDFRLESKPEESANPYMLFQTNEIITPKPFFLKEKNNSWYIQNKKTSESVSPFHLFNILAIATNKILGVFHYFQKNQNLGSEIIQAIWNQKNDNIGGRYENYINENCLYHRTKKQSGREYKLYKDKSPYEIGFRLVKLAKRTSSFDPNSAELGQVELSTSPEAVIAKLSDNNLVFALSATTDIPRMLKCFNIAWLEENTTFISLEKEDYEIIKARRDRKMNLRQTQVSLKIADNLSEEHPLGNVINNLFKSGYFDKGNEHEKAATLRYERILRMFDTLYKCANGNKYSHLIFVSTFGEFKEIIDYKRNENSLLFSQLDKHVFDCTRYSDKVDKFFKATIDGKQCSILLINSDDAKELQENPEYLKKYRSCFEMKEKVFVITQYKSASNGINLPCYPKMGVFEKDFEGIHLLEKNHFWFDNSKDFKDFKNNEKQALWYLWKLKDDGQFNLGQFNLCLKSRDNSKSYGIDIKKINNLYKEKADEEVLNSLALFHQALGRIERRDEKIPEVDITLDKQVFDIFYQFLSSEKFKDLVKKREDITSALILNVHQAVIEEAKRLNIKAELNAQKTFADKNMLSKELVAEMLNEINKVREGVYDEAVSNEIKTAWTDLREALLRHDFNKQINLDIIGKTIYIKRDFAFETKYINRNKELHIDTDKFKVYKEKAPNRKLSTWNLDLAYKIISKHSLLKKLFEKNGYKTTFDIKPNTINHILTPYIYQAILLGAIGEQAISFLIENKGITLENFDQLENSLFEIADAKVKDLPIYFDFKNFGQNTLDKFSFLSNNINFDTELNSKEFAEKIKGKYDLLKNKNSNSILYVLNLFSDQKRNPDFFDENMKRVTYEKDSCIRIIPSVLNPDNIEKFSVDFEASLKLINIYETTTM
ncbi:MAG: hypothetical protein K2Q03_04150 [Sphingobacteriaceae bacterium]|nr:hypothetical protein [Sphingobacteriaceae bacterium]